MGTTFVYREMYSKHIFNKHKTSECKEFRAKVLVITLSDEN